MRDGSYVIVDRLCEATTQLLEIIKKQEEKSLSSEEYRMNCIRNSMI